MHITYLGHSGFFMEDQNGSYLFDYYTGTLPILKKDKPLYIFISHGHHDHFNPEIFQQLLEQSYPMSSVTCIYSHDIEYTTFHEDMKTLPVYSRKYYELSPTLRFQTLKSTDEGVAFLLYTETASIYHAGDLNDWVWEGESEEYNQQMTKDYQHELDTLYKVPIDLAMIPLDPRQEQHYAKGLLHFMEKVNVDQVVPMHYWNQPAIIDTFCEEYPQYKHKILHTERMHQYEI